jgi:RNA exonuclease 4
MSSMVEYPLLSSENHSPSHLQSFRGDSSSSQNHFGRQPPQLHRGPPPPPATDNSGQLLLGHGSSHHNSSSRYNINRSPPRRYQSHIGITTNTNNGSSLPSSSSATAAVIPLNKSFRKSPNRAHSNVLGSSSAHNSNHSKNHHCSNFDPLSGSNHSTRTSSSTGITTGGATGSFQHSYKKPMMPAKQCYLAMDCEMVGTVSGQSVAARVVLVDWKGRKVYDSYCRPIEAVSDYRTFVSGVTADHLANAPSAEQVVQVVSEILHDKILVGHGLDNDLKALGLTHPWNMTRDTAYYQPFMRLLDTHHPATAAVAHHQHHHQHQHQQPVWGPRKLKDLAKEKLQRDIQVAGVSHCPVEDAAAALDLYKSHRPRWEACMSNEEKRARQQALQAAAAATAAHLYTHDFDELVVVAAAPVVSHNSLHSYSYHGAVSVAPAAPTASMMPSYHQHQHHQHHHHQSSFRQPTYPQRQRGMMDPLQSQSFHYPRSHTMAEYRDYNATAIPMSNGGGAASLDHHHSHSFHGFRHYSNSSTSSSSPPSSLYNYDPTSTSPIETVEEFGGDDESFMLSTAPEQQQPQPEISKTASLLQRPCVSN